MTQYCSNQSKSTTDALTLNTKNGDYYLWRPNHKGQQPISSITDLEDLLNNFSETAKQLGITDVSLSASIDNLQNLIDSIDGVSVGAGAGVVFKQKSNGVFQFRTIESTDNNIIVETLGDKINISLDSSTLNPPEWFYWEDTDPISADVGGLTGGTIIGPGLNPIEILEDILYEYFPPNLSIDLVPAEGYYEKWNNTQADFSNIAISGSFDNDNFKKVIMTDASVYSSVSGGLDTIEFVPEASIGGTYNFVDNRNPFIFDDLIYTVKLYNKVYNKVGTTDFAPVEASAHISFVNPYFFGTLDDSYDLGNLNSTVINSIGTKIIVPEQINEIDFDVSLNSTKYKFFYAYPEEYGELDHIYDTDNNFIVNGSFDSAIINMNLGPNLVSVPYRVYLKNDWISFNSDTSIFKLEFNI